MATRGIRNNNPGNIRHSPDQWLGEVVGADKAFKTFSSPVYGIRAIAKLLLNYERKYGLNTISGIISRWAPPGENDTTAYINAVAKVCGVGAYQVIDVTAYLPMLVHAIIEQENGGNPWEPSVIFDAIAMLSGGNDAHVDSGVVEAQAQPAQLGVQAGQVHAVEQGAVDNQKVDSTLPGAGAVIEAIKALAKSKTMGGVVGLLALQLLGIDKWDVALRIHDTIYAIPDLSQCLAVGLAGLATWGRVTAKPVGGKP